MTQHTRDQILLGVEDIHALANGDTNAAKAHDGNKLSVQVQRSTPPEEVKQGRNMRKRV